MLFVNLLTMPSNFKDVEFELRTASPFQSPDSLVAIITFVVEEILVIIQKR